MRIFSRSGSRRAFVERRRPPSGTISRSKRPSSRARSARSCDSSANASMSSRVMSHFSAIISAARNCDTSCVAVARLPALRAGERVGEAERLAGEHRRADRDHAHVLHAAGDDEVVRAAHHRLRGEVHGLLRRAALAVDGGARHLVGEPGRRASRCARCRPPAGRSCRRSRRRRRRRPRGSTSMRSIERADRRARRGRPGARRRARRRAGRPGVRTASMM